VATQVSGIVREALAHYEMAFPSTDRTPPPLAALPHRQSPLPVAGTQAAACPESVEGAGVVGPLKH
jgi:hypothetical protein